MKLLRRIGEILFPPKCILCGRILERNELDLCTQCRVEGPEHPLSRRKISFVDSWSAVWYYEGTVRRSILRYKFRRRRHYARSYGRILAMKILGQMDESFDLIGWVPISRWRKLRRGYDQVELLARAVGQEIGMEPVCCLRKIRHNPPQSGITGQAQRRANVLGVYEAVNPEQFIGKRVLLLDDVLTTGATLSECARVLLTAGAAEVHCAVVAAVKHEK